jgi:acetyl esterase/lipase/ketosteroid isomerase-like protein
MKRAGVKRILHVPYGESLPGDKGGRNLLDIVLPDEPGSGRPILLQIHGGGWMIGDKREQGGPLMGYLASRGWVCFAINYRLSPQAKFPAHIVDVKRALRWIREHAHEYGADPDFICVTGGSAGGHLTALTALVAERSGVPARVRVGRHERLGGGAVLRRLRLPRPREDPRPPVDGEHPDQVRLPVSARENPSSGIRRVPITRVSADAPPFLVVQGTHDTLGVRRGGARVRARAAREEPRAGALPRDEGRAARVRDLPLRALRARGARRRGVPRGRAREVPRSARSVSADTRETFERLFPALFSSDRAALLELIDENVVWHLPPFAAAEPRRGTRQRGRLPDQDAGEALSAGSLKLEPELSAVEGDRALLLGWMTGTTARGNPYRNRYVFAVRVRAGRIVEAWELLDSKLFLDQL